MNADVHALAGAYALDALPAPEAHAFTEHMAQCHACQQEVAELTATAAHLGLAVSEQPPAALRARVLEAARQSRQVPPAVADHRSGGTGRRWPRLLAAAAVTLLVGAGGLVLGYTLDDRPSQERRPQVAAVVDASDARADTVDLRSGGRMTVVSSSGRDQAVVFNEALPALARGRVYQLWLVDRGGKARSADVLIDTSETGSTRARLVRGLRDGDRIAITRERAGGAKQPTMAPLAITRAT